MKTTEHDVVEIPLETIVSFNQSKTQLTIVVGRTVEIPNGRCGDKTPHLPHEHNSTTLGKFWCRAEESN